LVDLACFLRSRRTSRQVHSDTREVLASSPSQKTISLV
jgi:hypothetical protein